MVTFQWTDNAYAMWAGSTYRGYDLFAVALSGNSRTVTPPTHGRPIYVTLYSYSNGTLGQNRYTYTAAPAGGAMKAQVTASVRPADGSPSPVCHDVLRRQFFFTLPKMLRVIFHERRRLRHLFLQTATECFRDAFRTCLRLPAGRIAVATTSTRSATASSSTRTSTSSPPSSWKSPRSGKPHSPVSPTTALNHKDEHLLPFSLKRFYRIILRRPLDTVRANAASSCFTLARIPLRIPAMKIRNVSILTVGIAAAILSSSAAQAALAFTNTFTGAWSSLTATGDTATNAVLTAEAKLSSIFSNNVNIAITFDYGAGPGSGAYASSNMTSVTYTALKADMQAASAANPSNTVLSSVLSYLPATNPAPSQSFRLPNANALALGLSASGSAGTVTIGNGSTWDAKQSDGITAGQGDLTGVLLHEISHVLGRDDYAFASQPSPYLTPLDLSRYTVGGGLNFTNSNAVFSINGGATALAGYSNTSDTGDWGSLTASNDVNNAFFSYGVTGQWSTVDTQVMEAIGWNVGPVPEPGTIFIGLALGSVCVLRRRRSA